MTGTGEHPTPPAAATGAPPAGRVTLPGSSRPPIPNLRGKAPVDASETVEVTLVLRRRAALPDELVTGRSTVDRAELAAAHGASEEDVATVTRVLTAAGLRILRSDPESRRIAAAGPVAAVATAFGTDLVTGDGGDGVRRRYRYGELSLPAELTGIVTAVLGLDERVQARSKVAVSAAARQYSYTPPQLGTIYRFPDGTDGSGQTIAIIELGGGFGPGDLATYFSGLGLATPSVTAVGVDGGTNVVGQDPQGADGEVLLDIEVAGALAPAASLVVYFAPNTDRGFLDAVTDAAHASPTPAAISISWGGPEDSWTAQTRTAMDDAFADAAALGVTVTAAAGDNGSGDGTSDGASHADFPASSPNVLACGGTSLHASPTTGVISSEVVWSGQGATGGGVSSVFGLPAWQAAVGVPPRPDGTAGRGLPDVAADADPATGYEVLVDGSAMVIGGTSAVAPLWAALATRLVQAGGAPLGLLAPLLYAGAGTGGVPAGFRDITEGNNGAFQAGVGWDACTGLGVPDGSALETRLTAGSPKPPEAA